MLQNLPVARQPLIRWSPPDLKDQERKIRKGSGQMAKICKASVVPWQKFMRIG